MRIHSLYGNWRFITVLICVGHSTLCFVRWIQSTSLLSTSFILKEKITSHLCPGLNSCRFPLYFQTKSLHPYLTHLTHVTCLLHTTATLARFYIKNPRFNCKKVKVKESRNRPGVAHRVPRGLGSQVSMIFGTRRWWDFQSHALAAFIPRKFSWYSFSLGAESTPGLWYGRKEYVNEKSSDITGNRSRERPTSSAAP